MRISVIIPTLNEESQIQETINSAQQTTDVEIIVVDGGSDDATLKYCTAADVVLNAPRGRAAQQNAGANAATGDILQFLHADCRLETGCLDAARAACEADDCVGGCYQQFIDAEGSKYRALEWGNALRVRSRKLAYGDQGIFVKAEVFRRLGGFPDLPLMEDLFFMKRLRRAGRFVLLNQRIRVSARRWQQRGVVRQTATNWTLAGLAQLGVSINWLATFYGNQR